MFEAPPPLFAAPPPTGMAMPGQTAPKAVGKNFLDDRNDGVPKDHDPTTEGRTLAAITLLVKIYFFFDASLGLFLSLVAMIVSFWVKDRLDLPSAGDITCIYYQLLMAGAAIVFVTRCFDVCMTCCDLCKKTTMEQFGRYTIRCLALSCFQCLLGLATCILAMLTAIMCKVTLAWLSVVFGFLLFCTAGEETYTWGSLYIMWKGMKEDGGSSYADQFINDHCPQCIIDYIDRNK
jgi:hypothetical protein